MMTAADSLAQTRPLLVALVERKRRSTGSKMAAYLAVARTVGRSTTWVRKVVGRQFVAIELHDYLNIANAYRAACERMEAEAELEKQRFYALGKAANAVADSAFPKNALEDGQALEGEGEEE